MSARHVLNADQTGPVQLPMFMRARDLADSLTGTLDKSNYSTEEVMEHKLSMSKGRAGHGHGTGVYSSVEKHGVINPVQLVHGMNQSLLQGQGHHRVAAAADISAETGRDMWMPVVHTDAREHSAMPLDIYSDPMEKRQAIAEYRRWSENTPAIGQDVGWSMEQERRAK